MAKIALVTGISGFVGGNLARLLLSKGWEVHGVVRSGSSLTAIGEVKNACVLHIYDGSIDSLFAILKSVKADVTFHLASLFLSEHTSSQVDGLIAANIVFGSQLLEAMTITGCKNIVNAGTSWQNFHSEDYRPVNLYAATKQAFEDVLKYYHDARSVSCVTLKLFDTYGPNDSRRKLIKILVEAALEHRPIDLSPGDQLLDLSHVDDVCDSFIKAADYLLCANAPLCESFTVFGERMTVKQLVLLISDALQVEIRANFGGRPYREREVMVLPVCDSTSAPWSQSSSGRRLFNEITKLSASTSMPGSSHDA